MELKLCSRLCASILANVRTCLKAPKAKIEPLILFKQNFLGFEVNSYLKLWVSGTGELSVDFVWVEETTKRTSEMSRFSWSVPCCEVSGIQFVVQFSEERAPRIKCMRRDDGRCQVVSESKRSLLFWFSIRKSSERTISVLQGHEKQHDTINTSELKRTTQHHRSSWPHDRVSRVRKHKSELWLSTCNPV